MKNIFNNICFKKLMCGLISLHHHPTPQYFLHPSRKFLIFVERCLLLYWILDWLSHFNYSNSLIYIVIIILLKYIN